MLNAQMLKNAEAWHFFFSTHNALYFKKKPCDLKSKIIFLNKKKAIFVSFNLITTRVELNQINVHTFTENPFLTSEFEITHIYIFSLKKKKPNWFQVIAFCFKGDNKSCYITNVNFCCLKILGNILYWLYRY